jgi:hypothetical protein
VISKGALGWDLHLQLYILQLSQGTSDVRKVGTPGMKQVEDTSLQGNEGEGKVGMRHSSFCKHLNQ